MECGPDLGNSANDEGLDIISFKQQTPLAHAQTTSMLNVVLISLSIALLKVKAFQQKQGRSVYMILYMNSGFPLKKMLSVVISWNTVDLSWKRRGWLACLQS